MTRGAQQLPLFAAPALAAAPPGPGQAALAARLPAGLRLGTSSWSFPGWAGTVYGETASEERLAREGLAAYARHPLLRAVRLDRTFYAPLPAAELARHNKAEGCAPRSVFALAETLAGG